MANNNHDGEPWPYHEDPNGNMVPCSNNPCSLHGGLDVIANNQEEATALKYAEKQTGMKGNVNKMSASDAFMSEYAGEVAELDKEINETNTRLQALEAKKQHDDDEYKKAKDAFMKPYDDRVNEIKSYSYPSENTEFNDAFEDALANAQALADKAGADEWDYDVLEVLENHEPIMVKKGDFDPYDDEYVESDSDYTVFSPDDLSIDDMSDYNEAMCEDDVNNRYRYETDYFGDASYSDLRDYFDGNGGTYLAEPQYFDKDGDASEYIQDQIGGIAAGGLIDKVNYERRKTFSSSFKAPVKTLTDDEAKEMKELQDKTKQLNERKKLINDAYMVSNMFSKVTGGDSYDILKASDEIMNAGNADMEHYKELERTKLKPAYIDDYGQVVDGDYWVETHRDDDGDRYYYWEETHYTKSGLKKLAQWRSEMSPEGKYAYYAQNRYPSRFVDDDSIPLQERKKIILANIFRTGYADYIKESKLYKSGGLPELDDVLNVVNKDKDKKKRY